MSKTRLEAFTDGVIAILITIMVLELRTPHGTTWAALRQDLPVLLAYVLSFVLIGIYWNNHHHMLAAVTRISGMTLWANQHLLFWLSLIPVATAWMSENHFPPIPVGPAPDRSARRPPRQRRTIKLSEPPYLYRPMMRCPWPGSVSGTAAADGRCRGGLRLEVARRIGR